jgi:hypothetical protein
MSKMMTVVAVCLAAAAGIAILRASGPIAVYALVDKVAFEPNDEKPERIRVAGVFSAVGESRQEPSDVYSEPQRGYLYFALPERNTDLALREWADLKAVAGTHKVVGFGSAWSAGRLRVRKADEKPESPDPYRMGNGVVKVNADNPKAKALLDYKER